MKTIYDIEKVHNKLTFPEVKFAYVFFWLPVFMKQAMSNSEGSFLLLDKIEELYYLWKDKEPEKQFSRLYSYHTREEIMDNPFDVERKVLGRLSLRPLKQKEIAQEIGCSIRHVARLQAGGILPKKATMQDVQGYLVGLTKRDPINNMETVEQILEKYKKDS